MKSFADNEKPIEIEDLHQMKCLNNNRKTSIVLKSRKNGSKWYSPTTMNNLIEILDSFDNNLKYKLIAGNTSKGIFKEELPGITFINIQNVKELYEITQTESTLTIGSNVTLAVLNELFSKTSMNQKGFEYLSEFSKLISKVANTAVRNVGTWSGNLNMKREHPSFPSDLFIAFKTIDATLTIRSSSNELIKVNLEEFLKTDMNKRFIYSIELKKFDKKEFLIKIFKVMPRSQMSHYYVTAGFCVPVQRETLIVNGNSKIVYGGVSTPYFESKSLSMFLLDKDLKSKEVFQESCRQLEEELNSDSKFHKSLALTLFYKFLLSVCPSLSNDRLMSAIESINDAREVSSGHQSYPVHTELFPLTQPIPKTTSYAQTTGEAVYNSDILPQPGQLEGALILSTVGNCKIDSINIEDALKVEGVKKIALAKDIPNENNIYPLGDLVPGAREELFAHDFVSFAGQPIGLVIADTFKTARYAASLVKVAYKDRKKPILSINEAIEGDSYHPKNYSELDVGNADDSIKTSARTLSGEFSNDGQFHFYLENLVAISTPTEDGFDIDCGGQWLDYVQKAVGQVVKVKNLSDIEIKSKHIGGGFGGKGSRAVIVACAAAVGSALVNKPVRVALDLNTNMRCGSKRYPQMFKYTVGFEENGKINGIKVNWYCDAGYLPYEVLFEMAFPYFDNCYSIRNIHVVPHLVKTNTPMNVFFRAPFTLPPISLIENIVDHVALSLRKDPLAIRRLNMYKKDDLTHIGVKLPYFNVDSLLDSLVATSDFENRKLDIEKFNKYNKWKKRGIAMIPMKYGAILSESFYTTMVTVFNGDGSVAITHGGIEIGQGINTKVAQVCAHELGIPLDKVTVKSAVNSVSANSQWTGASVTTEVVAKGIIECCRMINANLEPVRKLMPDNYTWKDLIFKAYLMNVDISARYYVTKDKNDTDVIKYDVYAAACSEVLIDVLTGDKQILRTDILYDCGRP